MSYKQFNRIRGLDGWDASWAQTLSRSETHVDLQGLTGRIAFVVDNADEAVAAVVLGLRHHLDMGIVTRDRLTDAVRTALYQAGAHLFDFSQRVLDKVPLTTAHQPGRVFVLTSGTTGVAKLVDHTWQTLNTRPREKALVEEETWFVPYQVGSYAWYQMICLGLFQDGQHIINADANDLVSSFTRNASSITAMSSTPTFWRVINMSVDEAALRSIPIRSISLGGEIVDQALLDRLGSLYPEADIRHIYASTEAGAAIVVKDRRAGFPKAFLDRPQRSASIRVADGRLFVQSQFSQAAACGRADQWLDTGDLVEVVDDRVYFRGRDKETVINVGGMKAFPTEIEAHLLEHPDVLWAHVKARRAPLVGALPTASLVFAKPIRKPEEVEAELSKFLRNRLPSHAVPRVWEFLDAIPVKASLKS
jgi:acyl-coenzyme A synthetase/AMP-(fatty) acid ligase